MKLVINLDKQLYKSMLESNIDIYRYLNESAAEFFQYRSLSVQNKLKIL